jgi:hypothetical protein
MARFKLIYIVSLVILGTLIGFALIRPMATDRGYSEVSREHLLQTEHEYIIEFDIKNYEGEDKNYTINVLIDGNQYREDVLIPDGSVFTYVQHVYSDRLIEKKVSFTICKDDETAPFEKMTYYLK